MKYTFLVGSYAAQTETGIYRIGFDPAAGLTVEAAGAGYANPSFVLPHPNGRVFYAVEETEAGAVVAGCLDGPLDRRSEGCLTRGSSPCHLSLSGDQRWLYAANYMSGSLAAFALDETGRILDRTDLRTHAGSGPNPERQEGPHAHFSMDIDGSLYVCDLGTDAVVIYRNAGGQLGETGRIAMPAGSGPRHLAWSPKHPDWLYCVAELGSRVYALRRREDGYEIVQSVSTLPAGFEGGNTAAAIRITEDGERLLASNRGHDSIAVCAVRPDGTLGEPVISGCVAEPRDFALCGDYVLAASQRDSVIRAYRLDRRSLRMEDAGMGLEIGHPVCLSALK